MPETVNWKELYLTLQKAYSLIQDPKPWSAEQSIQDEICSPLDRVWDRLTPAEKVELGLPETTHYKPVRA